MRVQKQQFFILNPLNNTNNDSTVMDFKAQIFLSKNDQQSGKPTLLCLSLKLHHRPHPKATYTEGI